jgi:Egh16-like virulence factor
MALSGNTLPQVSSGGFVSGIVHIVTSDGAGPYKALLDTTGTGNFTHAITMDVLTQVPGTNGNIKKTKTARALESLGIYKRASNINEDHVS